MSTLCSDFPELELFGSVEIEELASDSRKLPKTKLTAKPKSPKITEKTRAFIRIVPNPDLEKSPKKNEIRKPKIEKPMMYLPFFNFPPQICFYICYYILYSSKKTVFYLICLILFLKIYFSFLKISLRN